jgi:diguanylate cyclase (GGDEF)-like protein
MMVGMSLVVSVALILISGTVALFLAVAWHEFGRPVHALTWACAFALSAAMWGVDLIAQIERPGDGAIGGPMLAIAGIATMLNTLGFRQRAGIQGHATGLAAAALVNGVLVTLLAALGAPAMLRAAPFGLLNAVMFWLAVRALKGQRRKGERVAARAAQSGLLSLSLLNLVFLIGIFGTLTGMPPFDVARLGGLTILLMPGIVTGIGLFTIILLAADLADQARRLAATDMLTGLLNRRGFVEAGRALIASSRRHDRSAAVVMIDVDRFKQVNDRFGHPAGDRVLCRICGTIAAGISRRDIFARIGGEEFALIMADVDLAAAECAAEVLRSAVAAMEIELSEPLRVTASFGVAELREGDRDLADVMKRADEALYRAKASGRDRVVVAA